MEKEKTKELIYKFKKRLKEKIYSFSEEVFLLLVDFIDFWGQPMTWDKIRMWDNYCDAPYYHPFRQLIEKYFGEGKEKYRINKAFSYLKKKGYFREKGNKLILTPKGKEKIFRLKIKAYKKQKKKDRKVRIVVFDFPEKGRNLRDFFRKYIRELGYQQLQKSVWISNYDNFEELRELIKICGAEEFIKFFIAEKFINDI